MKRNVDILRLMDVLRTVRLFEGISDEELPSMLDCLGARPAEYDRGNFIFHAGEPAVSVGIVCSGAVQVIREDVFGNRAIQGELSSGELFGEVFACAHIDVLPVSVTAVGETRVLFVDYRRIVTMCPSSCAFHSRLVENMLGILARKNLAQNRKIEILSARTTRAKLLTYLASQAEASGARIFCIPFDRQELADFLSVERSAMSAELGRMQDDGLIRFHRNQFELLGPVVN